MFEGKRVCLITSGHVASDPRLVKEADALVEAGAEVTVIAAQSLSWLRAFDDDVVARRKWRFLPVDITRETGDWPYLVRGLRRRIARAIPQISWSMPGMAEAAWSGTGGCLRKAAGAIEAELYIAHNLAALPAAAEAARQRSARLGFDAEDLHSEELADIPANLKLRALARRMEDRYLPRCDHLTASSPMIAAFYGERYGRAVTLLLNVFPLSSRPARQTERSDEPSLYWFSQTIGPGRGLEPIVQAMARMKTRARLELRGAWAPGYESTLSGVARQAGVADRLRVHQQALPDDMVALAAQHHLGLSVELADTRNHALCLGNKIFTYLLAGVPVLLSDTPAQCELANQLGKAAAVVSLADPPAIAYLLDEWLGDPRLLESARRTARAIADTRFNWDVEKRAFLASVKEVL